MRQPVRVVLADDHDAFVEGLGMVLSAEADLEVVALAGDGPSTLQAVRTHRPDVLVVDTEMPGPAVTELVRLVGQAEPATRVLLLAEDVRPGPAWPAGPGGHAGMSRAVSGRQLAEAIRAVASPQPPAAGAPEREGSPPGPGVGAAVHSPPGEQAGGGVHRPGWPGGVGDAVRGPERPRRDDHAELLLRSLSEREHQVLGMLARGWSNRRIAETCLLSLNTVRTHVQNVLVKLGVHSKLEAAALAVRQGLVSLEDHPA
jgi:DNA-binding NarL/FixJ family response regulator